MIGAALMVTLGLGSASASTVIVDVQVIEASNTAHGSGAQSKAIRDLGATLNYKNFQTLSQEQRTLRLGEEARLFLPDGASAQISAVAVDEKAKKRTVRLRVRVQQGDESLDTEYSVRDGGTVFVSAGKGKSNGTVLVLAIAPRVK